MKKAILTVAVMMVANAAQAQVFCGISGIANASKDEISYSRVLTTVTVDKEANFAISKDLSKVYQLPSDEVAKQGNLRGYFFVGITHDKGLVTITTASRAKGSVDRFDATAAAMGKVSAESPLTLVSAPEKIAVSCLAN